MKGDWRMEDGGWRMRIEEWRMWLCVSWGRWEIVAVAVPAPNCSLPSSKVSLFSACFSGRSRREGQSYVHGFCSIPCVILRNVSPNAKTG